MKPDARTEYLEKVSSATVTLASSAYASRLAFVSLIKDLPLHETSEVDCGVEEARYRLRAAIHAQIEAFSELLDLVGE